MSPQGVPGWPLAVLMYHDLADDPESVAPPHRPYVVPAARFREEMRLLSRAGLTGTRLDALLGPSMASSSPGRRCVITFDDGHLSNVTHALPLLQEAGFSATFFVTAGWVGRPSYMTWEQVRALAASGMEIGSHSMTHRPPATLDRPGLFAELNDSRRLLEDRLGRPVLSASSPTGFFNPGMIQVAQEAGYQALCVGRIALWRGPSERFRIPRIPVKLGTRPEQVVGMALGAPGVLLPLRARQVVRNGLKRALGVGAYTRLRAAWLRIGGRG